MHAATTRSKMWRKTSLSPKSMQPVLREGRVVRNLVIEIELAEPAVCQMQFDFLGQLAL